MILPEVTERQNSESQIVSKCRMPASGSEASNARKRAKAVEVRAVRCEENTEPAGAQKGNEMKKLDGRTKAGRAAKLKAVREATEAQSKLNVAYLGVVTDINNVLSERATRYGDFLNHAQITQSIKFAMHTTEKWKTLEDDQMEALQMIAHKIGRILNGDPNYADSWVDIAGYAKLVADRLEKGQR